MCSGPCTSGIVDGRKHSSGRSERVYCTVPHYMAYSILPPAPYHLCRVALSIHPGPPLSDAMPASTSRSPSPVTAPPIAAAPGPRASALQKLYSEAVAHTIKTCNYANFASCFPTPAKHAPDAMKQLHGDFTQKLHHSCKASPHAPLVARRTS